jgi:hypothetical protein
MRHKGDDPNPDIVACQSGRERMRKKNKNEKEESKVRSKNEKGTA